MKKLNKNLKISLLLLIGLFVVISLLITSKPIKRSSDAYYRCALGVNSGYLRCVTITGPKADPGACAPAYRLLGGSKENGIDTNTDGTATCELIGTQEVHYFDKNGYFIETKPSENRHL